MYHVAFSVHCTPFDAPVHDRKLVVKLSVYRLLGDLKRDLNSLTSDTVHFIKIVGVAYSVHCTTFASFFYTV